MTRSVNLDDALRAIATELHRLRRRFALVGGLAVSVRGEVRFTRDVDLAVGVEDDPDAEQLVRDLGERGYRVVAVVEQDAVGRLATVRLVDPAGVKVDLLFASSGLEAEVVARAEVIESIYGDLPVARSEELVALKVLSVVDERLQDRIDLRSLVALGVDLDVVRANLKLIMQRGYARGQDLPAKLAAELGPR